MNIVRYQRFPQSDLNQAFDRLASLQDEMDRVFDFSLAPFVRTPGSLGRWTPAVDVYQDKEQFTLLAELPGMSKDQIEISLHNDTVTMSGERKRETKGEQGNHAERYFGRFQRSITLPAAVQADKVTAAYENGILRVVLPKAEEAKPKQISLG
ncbi:MAG: Hsp20/alpha crystallin family protein [Verrucomicrobia bacterium]|nr:Hsp20/alpha crystallin family protein [Verrucomicrobiota bacterium]